MPLLSASASPALQPIGKTPAASLASFAVTIFLSAFLLFQVQPLIAKLILPWFGGSAAVWTSCMLFFQMALLLGYAYAHWSAQSTRPRLAAWLHIGLLVVSLASLPILPGEGWKPQGTGDPLLRILGLLAATIGLPYFLLSSTSPLLQSWFSRSTGGSVPYRFFALSNTGSLLALLTYPVLVEPLLTGRRQAWMWSAGYVVFVALCARIAWQYNTVESAAERRPAIRTPAPDWRQSAIWVALAASASALLLSITNHISQNVAAIPFLWILPLSLYLLSFILCFDSSRWYHRPTFLRLLPVALGALAYAIADGSTIKEIRVMIPLFTGALFICCMVCHGELSRLKPAPDHLTGFYLMISVGGAIGGLFVALIAPYVFNALYELPVAICVCALAVLAACYREAQADLTRRIFWWIAAALSIVTAVYLAKATRDTVGGARLLARNFYGALRVNDYDVNDPHKAVRRLTHGTINHGEQFLDPQLRHSPITYYGPDSGVALAIRELQRSGPIRAGVVGLGSGNLAAFGRAGDTFRIYEINPLVLNIAQREFTNLRDCPAKVDVIMGDARLSLERESSQQFDVLAVDAFSSDSIPVHLLTREAFAVYWRHLKRNGVLAIHVSNKYLALAPVVRQHAVEAGKQVMMVSNESDDDAEIFSADWVLVSSRPGFFDTAAIQAAATRIDPNPKLRTWTDDYSNLWQILR